jgi:hypothetical protein
MAIRELVTKLSYTVDKTGLHQYAQAVRTIQAQAQAMAKSVNSSISGMIKGANPVAEQARQSTQAVRNSMQEQINAITGVTRARDREHESRRKQQLAYDALFEKSINKELAGVRKVAAERRKVANEAKQQVQNLARYSNWFGNSGMMFGGAGLATTMGLLKKGIDALTTMRSNEAAMKGMLGNDQLGEQLQKRLEAFAERTTLDSPHVGSAAKLLVGSGVKVEDLMDKLQVLGDAAMGNNEVFERLALQYMQVKARTYTSWDEMRRFMEAGIPMLPEMSKLLGISPEEIMKRVSNREISFEMFDATLQQMTKEGSRKGAMEKQMGTLGAKMIRASENVTFLLRDFAMAIEDDLKGIFDGIRNTAIWLRKLDPKVMKAIIVGAIVTPLVFLVAGVASKLASTLLTVTLMFFELMNIKTMVAAILLHLKIGFASLIAKVAKFVTQIIIFVAKFTPLFLKIALVVGMIVGLIWFFKDGWQYLKSFLSDINKFLQRFGLGTDHAGQNNARQYYYQTATGQATGIASSRKLDINSVMTLKVEGDASHIQKSHIKKMASEVFKDDLNKQFLGLQVNTVGVR